jgi:hypothetical protein
MNCTMRGAPPAGHPYRIEQPEGSLLKTGRLNGQGRARLTDRDLPVLLPEDCIVTFPGTRPEEEAAVDVPANWVQFELLDPVGHPAAGWRYRLCRPDGEEAIDEGTLDAFGRGNAPLDVEIEGVEVASFHRTCGQLWLRTSSRAPPTESNWSW